MEEGVSKAIEEGQEPMMNAATGRDYWGEEGLFQDLPMSFRESLETKSEYLELFWSAQKEDMSQMTLPRVQPLPPKRIRRIIKCDEDVMNAKQRVGKEVVELFGVAAEMFIAELSLASWMNVPEKKKVVQVEDISAAVGLFHSYDFLQGVVPPPEPKAKRVRKRLTTTSKQTAGAVARAESSTHVSFSKNGMNHEVEADGGQEEATPEMFHEDNPITAQQPPPAVFALPVTSPLAQLPSTPSIAHFTPSSYEHILPSSSPHSNGI